MIFETCAVLRTTKKKQPKQNRGKYVQTFHVLLCSTIECVCNHNNHSIFKCCDLFSMRMRMCWVGVCWESVENRFDVTCCIRTLETVFFYHFQFIRCTLSTQNLKSLMNCKKEKTRKNLLQIQNINRIFEFDLNTTFPLFIGHQIFLTRPFREQCAHTPQFIAMVWLSGWIRMKLQYFIRGGK